MKRNSLTESSKLKQPVIIMPLSRKIFFVANIVEMVLFIALVTAAIYISPMPHKTIDDLLVFLFVVSLPLITAANGISNLSLVSLIYKKAALSKPQRFFFWVAGILFLAVVLLVGYLVTQIYWDFLQQDNKKPEALAAFICLSIILINGIYLLVYQTILFFRIKKENRKRKLEFVETIGQ